MNPADLAPIAQQVNRHTAADWSWCLLRPDQTRELLDALTDAYTRLAQIDTLTDRALMDWAENNREGLRGKLEKVRDLCLTN